jgi:sulfoquinovosyltransferase
MKICIITEPCPVTYTSGLAVRMRLLVEHLVDEANDSVELISAEAVQPNRPMSCHNNTVAIHYTYGLPFPGYSLLTMPLDWTWKVWRTVRRMRPDLIHCTSPGMLVFPALFCARVLRIPIVMSYHTHIPVYVRTYLPWGIRRLAEWIVWRMIRATHSLSDLTLVTSSQILDQFQRRGIPRCELWQKGVDTSVFSPKFYSKDMRDRMSGGNPQDFLLVYVGRIAVEKRLHELRDILRNIPNSRLCIVGKGPYESELIKLLADTSTVFAGELHGTDLSQAFASGDCFVMPSDSETLGFVLLESMASGVPVVAAAAGGIPDIVQDTKNGFLVPTGNSTAFTSRIKLLQGDPELRQKMSVAARESVSSLGWMNSMQKVRMESYSRALNNFDNRWEQKILRLFHPKR